MNTQTLSTNIDVNYSLINIIKIIKNIKFQYKLSHKETIIFKCFAFKNNY